MLRRPNQRAREWVEGTSAPVYATNATTDGMCAAQTCHYHEWQDVTAARVVSFLTHEVVAHLFDQRRHSASQEVSHARWSARAGSRRRDA
jgi:hypothetical protein